VYPDAFPVTVYRKSMWKVSVSCIPGVQQEKWGYPGYTKKTTSYGTEELVNDLIIFALKFRLALWIHVDKAVKKCLVAMWRLRRRVGGLAFFIVVASKLVIVPCCGVSVIDLLARQELTRVITAADVDR
jgi:hypothetical protein